MPKPKLKEPFHTLEHQLVYTMMAGHKQWRPDLPFPQSYSDMEACARAVLRMFKVERAPLPIELPEDE